MTANPCPFVWLFVALATVSRFSNVSAAAGDFTPGSSWPQFHEIRAEGTKAIRIENPYYVVEHDLTRGGAIARVWLRNGGGELLAAPVATEVSDKDGQLFSETNDHQPHVKRTQDGPTEVVEIESRLMTAEGKEAPGVLLRTRYEHHWGYVKVRREFRVEDGRTFEARSVTPFRTKVMARLDHYGYRDGLTEEEKAPAFAFGSCHWGQLNGGTNAGVRLEFLPRYVMCAEPGVGGIEWFMGSSLRQWNRQFGLERGHGEFRLGMAENGEGAEISVSAWKAAESVRLGSAGAVYEFFLGWPLKEARAQKPWLHTSFNRNKGEWVTTEQVRRWAESGIQTVHCHNDGDYYEDGLFWRDGSYPPYPDMDRYDRVLADCRAAGIRTATYFSNKELHPSTEGFQKYGQEWARRNLSGNLQHNIFKGTNEFGVQMCLRSGWLGFLEESIDRVLRNHRLDGVYYDWNVALLCHNPLHEPGVKPEDLAGAAHWDIEELLQLMEWTRFRVGPSGVVIVHNTTTPMFVMENFADYVVANEWGYGRWKGGGPTLEELPLEWSLVGARARGVISYGQLDANSPRRLHRVFALQALLGGVTPWPASPETCEIFPILKPIGDVTTCRFADWRNKAVKVRGERCGAAVYSRPGESWVVVANTGEAPQRVGVRVDATRLPVPMESITSVSIEGRFKPIQTPLPAQLDAQTLTGTGLEFVLDGDSVVLLKLSGK